MIEKMLKLDSTDFMLFLTEHDGFVVHEFEGEEALIWHIYEKRLAEKWKCVAIYKW